VDFINDFSSNNTAVVQEGELLSGVEPDGSPDKIIAKINNKILPRVAVPIPPFES